MAPVSLSGLSSVSDRTLFTRRAPIVKQPLALLTGTDLTIVSPTSIRIISANFTSSDIGKTLSITGSLDGRNDGMFDIIGVPNSVTAVLADTNFDMINSNETLWKVILLANDIKLMYNKHRVHKDSRLPSPYTTHIIDDTVYSVTSPDASDLSTAITLLNEIQAKFSSHILDTSFHTNYDRWNQIFSATASSLASAITLVNEIRTKFDAHRLERRSHLLGDADSRVSTPKVTAVFESTPGSLIGPFTWTLYDPRRGTVADSPDDVIVRVNGSPVDVEAVFGMIGAVILSNKPSSTDTVVIDYDYINNPPARFLRLNSPEFVLNQDKNNGIMGLPSHRYRARSYLIDPGHTPDLISAKVPFKNQWKYKAYERIYTASTNDPAKLLLNSPFKDTKYPVLHTVINEKTISYDPIVLPQNTADPWVLEGDGTFAISNGLLTIVDDSIQVNVNSKPPFYTYISDIVTDSLVSAAFRVRVDNSKAEDGSEKYQLDGVFTGVGFGISDGFNVALVGFTETQAMNLSSAIWLANIIKSKFNSHIVQPTVHGLVDTADTIEIVDVSSLELLIVLLNSIKSKYNFHILKADPTHVSVNVHKDIDLVNDVISIDATNLETAITLANELREKFNLHRLETDIHFVDDTYNEVPSVTQIGILKNTGAYEFQESWESSAIDWSILRTYRVYRDPSGNIQLYTSGDIAPLISVSKSELPSISDFGGKFDPVQQIFFGSISKEATSSSVWNLIRANISPVNSNLLGDNKSVSFDGSVIPELDTISPWITLGHGGTERIYAGLPGGLQVDSTCCAGPSEITAMGLSSGAFRGYMRFEPILSKSTSCTVEFEALVDYHTFGIGNRSDGVFIDDNDLSVHFSFLYFSPSPAIVTGGSSTFSIDPSDKLFLIFDGLPAVTISFSSVLTTASAVAAVINATLGSSIASDDGLNHVRLTYGLGASSYVEIVGGTASKKLGLTIGKYFGRDSNPEPKVSWFSETFPDLMEIPWIRSGVSSTTMIGAVHSPVMRVDDTSTISYVTFTMSNPVVVAHVMEQYNDWKLDFRLKVNDFTAGDVITASLPFIDLYFCGVLVNVDEGYSGKNIELHLSVDSSNNPYLNLVTFDSGTNTVIPIGQYAFAWNDGNTHSFNIFTNKSVDQIFVCADGVLLIPTAGSPTYTTLGPATGSISSVTFGSGGEAVSNVDLRTAISNVDWESVTVFRDSKLSDPLASSHRYVGIYRGGDPTLLNSWIVANVDWTTFHVYRIVRNPTNSVSVYLDGGDTPVISVSYDPIRLPPYSSSFLRQISNNRPVIAWGSFDPIEICRTRWRYLNYSIGKLTLTDRIVPPHQITNQANVMASPDHIRTRTKHKHFGFSVYSGGTPTDDFMSNFSVPAYTILGERIPPVPMTQDLESRGGLVRSATPAADISAYNFMNQNGFLGEFEDDTINTITAEALSVTDTLLAVISVTNSVSSVYETHRLRHGTAANVHIVDDVTHTITAPPASDLPTAIASLIDFKAVFNSHISDGTSHTPIDTYNTLVSVDPIDLDSCVVLVNEVNIKYNDHLTHGYYHRIPSSPPYIDTSYVTTADATDAPSCLALLEDIKQKFIVHALSLEWHNKAANYFISLNYSFMVPLVNHLKSLINQHTVADGVHVLVDTFDAITTVNAHDTDSAIILANEIKSRYNTHISGQQIHRLIDLTDGFTYPYILTSPLQSAITLANEILEKFNAHVFFLKSHAEKDTDNVVKTPLAFDESSVIELSNSIKRNFNLHRTSTSRDSKVHVRDDTVNVVAYADATDLDSAINLLNAIKLAYESHRTQVGIHGSTAFIRLDAPSRVLYEGMKFWKEESGTLDLTSSFSDDETWHVDSINYTDDKSLTYDGSYLPERATVLSVGSDPSSITDGDTLIVEIDRLPPVTVTFQSTDITLTDVVNRINLSVPGCASVDSAEIRLSSGISDPSSSVIVNGGTAQRKLGFIIPHHSPWFMISENPADISTSILVDGTDKFLRYEVDGPSTTMYTNMVGYPMSPSIGFNMTAKLRINATSMIGGDSGVYVGLSGSANVLGFTVAIGWDEVASVKYVKVQDMSSGNVLDRIPLDWLDGEFHTYNLVYSEVTRSIQLFID